MDDEIVKDKETENNGQVPGVEGKSNTDKKDEGEKVSGRTDENNSEGTKSGKDGSGQAENTPVTGQEASAKSSGRGDHRGETSPRRPDKLKVGATKSDKGSSGGNDKQPDKTEQPVRHSFLFQRRRQAKETNKG